MAWCRRSGEVSINTWRRPACSGLTASSFSLIRTAGSSQLTSTLHRSRWSRGSSLVHTAQGQPIIGTPALVPVPRKWRVRGMGKFEV